MPKRKGEDAPKRANVRVVTTRRSQPASPVAEAPAPAPAPPKAKRRLRAPPLPPKPAAPRGSSSASANGEIESSATEDRREFGLRATPTSSAKRASMESREEAPKKAKAAGKAAAAAIAEEEESGGAKVCLMLPRGLGGGCVPTSMLRS